MVAGTDQEVGQRARLFDLWAKVSKEVVNGNRRAWEVAEVLQVVKDEQKFYARFFPEPAAIASTEATGRELVFNLEDWAKILKDVFGVKLDPKKVVMPERPDEFLWGVVNPGLNFKEIVRGCRTKFKVWLENENMKSETVAKRPKTPYPVFFRDRVEADEEFKNKSALDLERQGANVITVEERLLLELWYFLKTSRHLDLENWTYCAGSRDACGNVPHVHWNSHHGEVHVSLWHPRDQSVPLRAREAVS